MPPLPALAPRSSVALIEDDPSYRSFLIQMLKGMGLRFELVGAYASGEEALAALPHRPVELALVDIELPGMPGIETVVQLRQRCPATRCVMLTNFDETDYLFAALEAGASGYLLKSDPPAQILAGLEEAWAGGAPLSRSVARRLVASFATSGEAPRPGGISVTRRESEILDSLSHGLTYKEIGRRLGISTATVKNHLYRVYEKLDVRSRTEAVIKWIAR